MGAGGEGEALVYECDAYTIQKDLPDVVVLPTSTEQVAAVVRLCSERGVPFVGQGAVTGQWAARSRCTAG